MKQILLSVTILLALTSQGQSQVLTKKEKIKSLFALMHQDSLMIKTIDGMTASMAKNMATIFNDTAYTNHGIDVSKWTQKLMEKSMQKSKENALKLLNGDMVDIYDKYFTIEDIDDFATFYKSRSGQKMLTQMPDITKDIMTIMTTKYQKDFQQSFMKDIQEMKNEMTEQMKTKQK
jgi:hypothetical protein